MSRRVNLCCEVKEMISGAKAKASLKRALVEKSVDELRLGVKCQSSQELAGSPRNAFRHSVGLILPEVEH